MKKTYLQPQADSKRLSAKPLLVISEKGTKVNVIFDNIEEDGDAGTATSRPFNIWDDDTEE